MSKRPTDEQLIILLQELEKDAPSARLYQILSTAPWHDTADQSRGTNRLKAAVRKFALAMALFVFLGLGLILISIMSRFDGGADSGVAVTTTGLMRETTMTPTPQPSPVSAEQWEIVIVPTVSVQEAEAITGFDVIVPPLLPDDYRLLSTTAYQGSVVLHFQTVERSPLTRTLALLLQSQITSEPAAVYESAQDSYVTIVRIGNTQGTYLSGSWTRVSSTESQPIPVPSEGVMFPTTQALREVLIWSDGGILYTLTPSHPMRQIGQENMVAIARCMYIPFHIQQPNNRFLGTSRPFRHKNINCDLEQQSVTQTYLGREQLMVLRQQPVDAPAFSPLVQQERVMPIELTLKQGQIIGGEKIEGIWLADLPPEHEIGIVSNHTVGYTWMVDDMRFELWLVGESQSSLAIGEDVLSEIIATLD